MEELAWVSELEWIAVYENSTTRSIDKLMDNEVKNIFLHKENRWKRGKNCCVTKNQGQVCFGQWHKDESDSEVGKSRRKTFKILDSMGNCQLVE